MIKNVFRVSGLLLAAALLLSACGTPQVTLPTADLNLVRTEAVQTAMAQQTKEALLVQPSATQKAATTTTPVAGTATATLSVLSGGTTGGSSGSSGGSYSGGTPLPSPTPVVYKAQYITQNYPDGYNCATGQVIDYIVTLKNIGLVTWDTTYYYKMIKESEPIAKHTLYFLPRNVAPGEKIDLIIDINCPTYPGPSQYPFHTTEWGLVNDNGELFAKFWFGFKTVVHTPIVPTKTPTTPPG